MKFKFLIAAVLALSAVTVQAQLGRPGRVSALTFAGTTNFTAAATNAIATGTTNYISCEGGKEVTLSWRFQHAAAASTDNVLVLATAVEDGKPATTQQKIRWLVTPNGSTEVVGTTNVTVNGARRLYITSFEQPSANGITNSVLSYSVK